MKETAVRIAAGVMLLGGMSTACGDEADDTPDDPSTAEFCGAMEAGPDDGRPSQDELDDWVDELRNTGTPADLTEDERNGFESIVEAMDDADVDDFDEESQLEDLVRDEDDREDAEKFFTYYVRTCAAIQTPSDWPSEVRSDRPTVGPTEAPPGEGAEQPSILPSKRPPTGGTKLPSGFPSDLFTMPPPG